MTRNDKQRPEEKAGKAGSPHEPELPADEHGEELIDEALAETFPASDPISIPAPEDQTDPDDKSKGGARKKRRTG